MWLVRPPTLLSLPPFSAYIFRVFLYGHVCYNLLIFYEVLSSDLTTTILTVFGIIGTVNVRNLNKYEIYEELLFRTIDLYLNSDLVMSVIL